MLFNIFEFPIDGFWEKRMKKINVKRPGSKKDLFSGTKSIVQQGLDAEPEDQVWYVTLLCE